MAGDEQGLARSLWWTSMFAGAAFAGAILVFDSRFLIPLAVAFMLWLLLNALARSLRRLESAGRRLQKPLCKLFAIPTIIALFWLMVDISARNSAQVREAAPAYQDNLVQLIEQITERFDLDQAAIELCANLVDEPRGDVSAVMFEVTV